MGLAFPALLLAALAVAVPVWVHLAFRPHAAGRILPSLMFLKAVELKVRRNRQLRDRALLIWRVLLLLLLVAAFAGPFVELSGSDSAARAPAVVIIDQSASMTVGDRWSEAVASARSLLRATDRQVALLGAAHQTVELTPFGASRSERLAALASAEPRMERSDLGAAIQHAAAWLARHAREQQLPANMPGQVTVVTDLQASALSQASLRALPGHIQIDVEVVGGPVRSGTRQPNLGIESMRMRGDSTTLEVTVRNTDSRDASDRELFIQAGDHPLAQQSLSVSAGASRVVTVPVTRAPDRAVVLRAALAPDDFSYDDTNALVLAPARTRQLGLLGAGALGSVHQSAFGSIQKPPLSVAGEATPDRVRNRQLDLIYIEDLQDARTDLALGEFVDSGGVVIALVDSAADFARLRRTLDSDGETGAWPPATAVDALRIDPDSALPQLHEAARILGSLGASHGLGFTTDAERPALLYWNDGRAAAFVRSQGQGRIVVLGLSSVRGVLARRPELAPILQALLRVALDEEAGRPNYTAGEIVERPSSNPTDADLVLLTPGGVQRVVRAGRDLVAPAVPGVYTVTGAEQVEPWQFAVRPDIRESQLEPLTRPAFEKLVDAAAESSRPANGGAAAPRDRYPWAWWLVFLATVAALAELLSALRCPSAATEMRNEVQVDA
ncbi:MAG: VWA domain-containing protein [Pseudomonadota bacterium]